MKIISLTILFLFLASSCATQRIYTTENANTRIPSYEGTSHFFLYGIGQTKEISASFVCNDRPVEAVETQYSFINGLLVFVTYGIYYPMSYSIYCGKKPKKKVEKEED